MLHKHNDAGWSSSVARWAHNPEVAGSNPVPATISPVYQGFLDIPGFFHLVTYLITYLNALRRDAMNPDDLLYPDDLDQWTTGDYEFLWRYLNRWILSIGPTPAMETLDYETASPKQRLAVDIQRRRTGRYDDLWRSVDLDRMPHRVRYLLGHMLIHGNRYDLALRRFDNLAGLADSLDPDDLDEPIVLRERPFYVYPYYTEHKILL